MDVPVQLAPFVLIISVAMLGVASFTTFSFALAVFLVQINALLSLLLVCLRKRNIMTQVPVLILASIVLGIAGWLLGFASLSLVAVYCVIALIIKAIQIITASSASALATTL